MATLDRLVPPSTVPSAPAWKPRRAIAAAFVAATAIALLQVLQSSNFTNAGAKLQRMEAQRSELSAQVRQLEAEVAALSSLDRTERAARERLGMVAARRTDHVSVQIDAPPDPLLPRPIINQAPRRVEREPWWRSLLEELPRP
jgi:cell division protein FtsL